MKISKTTKNGKQVYVIYYTVEGQKKRKFFQRRAGAEKFLRDHKQATASAGRTVADALTDGGQVKDLAQCLKILEPYGATLLQAVNFYADHHKQAMESKTFDEACEALQDAKQREGKAHRYLGELKGRLGAIKDHFGADRKLSTVTADEAMRFLDGLTVAPQTRNHFRRVAHLLFHYAEKRGWASDNPFARTEKAKVVRELPAIFSPMQLQAMLESAPTDAVKLYLALGAWAGLRPSETARLTWEAIHLDARVIDLSAQATKSARRRLVEIRPALADVLTELRQLSGPVCGNVVNLKAFKTWKADLGFEWPHDGLRHSFGTYHLAAFEDAGKTALQMGHGGNPSMLFQHYNRPGIARNEALRYWQETDADTESNGKGVGNG